MNDTKNQAPKHRENSAIHGNKSAVRVDYAGYFGYCEDASPE